MSEQWYCPNCGPVSADLIDTRYRRPPCPLCKSTKFCTDTPLFVTELQQQLTDALALWTDDEKTMQITQQAKEIAALKAELKSWKRSTSFGVEERDKHIAEQDKEIQELKDRVLALKGSAQFLEEQWLGD